MALSGEFYGSTNNGFIKPKITWQARQSPEENCSLVTATLTYSRTNTGYTTAGFWSGSLCIDTDTKTDSRNISISYESNTVAITHTVQVEHDAYGCAQVSISATGSIYGTTLESTTISQLITLDTIALASTIGATDAFVEAVSMVAISRKNAAYTHTVALSCNGYEGYLTENGSLTDAPEKLSATAIAFTVPESFYALLPDSPTAQVQLTCVTYNGDTQVGTPQEAAFTVTARESLCAPVLTLRAEDTEPATTALTGDKSTLVRFCSQVRCTINAQGQRGAQIVAKRINGNETQLDEKGFERVESGFFTASATDSRGYTTQQQVELPMVNYIQLTVNVSAKRMDPTSGKALLQVWGNYFNGSFGAQDNSLALTCHTGAQTVQLQPVLTDEGYRAEAVIEGLDYLSHHILTVTATDAIGAVSATERVKPGIPVFDWGQKDFAFHVPVHANAGLQVAGKPLWEHIYPVGAIYMSVNETDPGELFGGTWERIKDSFLLSSGEVYAPGTNGGEAEHTLTNEELPANMGKFAAMRWPEDLEEGIVSATQKATNTAYYQGTSYGSGAYTLSGGGQAHNNMPPYLAVYVWKRVA